MHTPSLLTMLLISSQPLDAKNLFFQGPKTRKNSFSRVHLGIHSYRLGEFLFLKKVNFSQWDFSIVFSLQSWRGLSAKSATGFWFSNTFCGRYLLCFSVWVAPIQSKVFRPSESSIDLMSQSFLTSRLELNEGIYVTAFFFAFNGMLMSRLSNLLLYEQSSPLLR